MVSPGVKASSPMAQRIAKRLDVTACLKVALGTSQNSSSSAPSSFSTKGTSHSSTGDFAFIRSEPIKWGIILSVRKYSEYQGSFSLLT